MVMWLSSGEGAGIKSNVAALIYQAVPGLL
jgi:hypothetical protein